jgi:hypothetical protein
LDFHQVDGIATRNEFTIGKLDYGMYTIISFVVFLNGSPLGFFTTSIGLRQGFPLSPFLFMLVAEGLSLLIKDARWRGVLKGVKVSNSMNIMHLLFFDDVLMFGDGTSQELRSLRIILDLYCKAIGMELNLRKSCMLLNYIPMDASNQIKDIMSITCNEFEQGFKYLGFYLKPNKYRFEDWLWLYKKIEVRILVWVNMCLSRGGYLVLIKVVLESIPVYWTSTAKVSTNILTKIRKKCFGFL